jgi:hypothetical protein
MKRLTNCRQRRIAVIGPSVALWSFRLAMAAGLLWVWPRSTQAQAQAPPPAPVVTVSRSWYFEALIVIVMMGLALFVVCRSSRRN